MDGQPSPLSCMWYTPTFAADFTLSDARAANHEPGYAHLRLHAELSQLRTDLCDEVRRILSESTGDRSSFPSQLLAGMTAVTHAWLILTTTAAGFDEKRLEFVEFQRAWLELRGLLNFREWKGAAELNLPQSPPETRPCIGCFVESQQVAMRFYDMGIPVWVVRDKMAVLHGDIFIERPTTLTVAPQHFNPPICIERDASFPIIYSSNPRHLQHYQEQQKFSRIRFAICAKAGGQMVVLSTERNQMDREGALTCLRDLKTMRAFEAAKMLDSATQSSSSSTAPSSSASSAQYRGHRHAPCRYFTFWDGIAFTNYN